MTDEQLQAIMTKADYDLDALKDRVHEQYEEIQELKVMIDKAIEYMSNYIEVEDAPINERIKIEFKEVLNILQGDE